MLQVFLGCRSHLPLFHTLGVFLLKQDLKGQEHQFQIQHKAVVFNISQIQLQLIVRRRIIFAVNLLKSGQPRLYL